MPNLSIKDVPESVARALKQRATSNQRSLQEELMAILNDAVRPGPAATLKPPAPQGWRRGTRTIEEAAERLRAKYPEPIRGMPLGVDIIRKDRDTR